jgi:hypothetical protein
MDPFEKFEGVVGKISRLILLVGFVITVLMAIVIFILVSNKQVFVWKNEKALGGTILKTDVCKKGFIGIANKNANEYLVSKSFYGNLEGSNYKHVDFENASSSDFLKKIRMSDEHKCKVIINDSVDGREILRAFSVEIVSNDNFVFDYKINGIEENVLKDSDRR